MAEALIKKQDLHEGIWMLAVSLGMQATNIGSNEMGLKPAAVVAILSVSLQKTDKETSLSVDAAKVNPRGRQGKRN